MNILVTGGAGFVGLNIVERLLKAGMSVVSYGSEAPPPQVMDYLGALGGRFEAVQGDVRDGARLRAVFAQHGITDVVHGAAITAGLERERAQPHAVIEVNLLGTLEVLAAAASCGIRRVVQLGTGSVYGARCRTDGLLDPDQDPPVPDSLYGVTKYAAERLACRYRAQHGLDVVVARLGVVFGRWEHDTGVRDTLSIPYQILGQARAGGTAALARQLPDDWVYAPDVAQAVHKLLLARELGRPVYQIGTGGRWSAQQWCELVRARFPGFEYRFVDTPEQVNVGRQTPTPRAPFSIAALRDEVGYRPEYDAAAALDDYLAWLALGLYATGRNPVQQG
ncbi:NAD(P)H-binding protein, PF13460 family [Bordetella bronchiseptica MBORD635]|uniref:NAD-dependent epimerase/dehydratase family protein n=1 Tax=Bordetella bronchiseptica TaxID=518 RepID=UPI000461183D|nr:NAD(P)-dependent oxidoreductase [Bordetella bronchiseptica]KDC79377.1 NAD(P)H-binding protein, PF13460 family [Bordetella bronchiseptica MBORD635]